MKFRTKIVPIGKHKVLELSLTTGFYEQPTIRIDGQIGIGASGGFGLTFCNIFGVDFDWRFKGDHRGLFLLIRLFGINFDIEFYDTRHEKE